MKNARVSIGAQVSLDERRRAFFADAAATDAQMLASGEGYAAEDVHRYFRARVRGDKPRRPKPIQWRR